MPSSSFRVQQIGAKIKLQARTWLMLGFIFIYLVLCLWVVFIWASPEAAGNGVVHLGPDSGTYYLLGRAIENAENELPLLSFGSNLIGPLTLVLLLKNAFAIAAFNTVLFLIALRVASSIRHVRLYIFTFLVLVDAETLSSITTVNKEIFALFSVVLFAKYLEHPRKLLLLLMFLSAVMARWEQAAVMLLFFCFRQLSYFRTKVWRALAFVVLAITLAWPFALAHIDTAGFDFYTQGARTMAVLNTIQGHYGFFLVIIPKIIMNLIGTGSSPNFWLTVWPTMDHNDVQNAFLIRLHELVTTCVVGVLVFQNKVRLQSPLILFSLLYLIVTCTNLFVQSRYDYPIYILLSLELAKCLTVSGSSGLLNRGSGQHLKQHVFKG